MLLAIDTATRMAGLALYDEVRGLVLGEEAWYAAYKHTVELMPRLVRLLDGQGVQPTDLTGIAVSLGPGSYTGLRIGLSVAKGLALARKPIRKVMIHEPRKHLSSSGKTRGLDGQAPNGNEGFDELPLVGIPTLDIVAHPHMVRSLPIWAIIEAGRGRICVGHYVSRHSRWRLQGRYRRTTIEEMCDEVEGESIFCGEISSQDADLIHSKLGRDALIVSPASAVRRAGYLAELGWQRLARGDMDDVTSLTPIYLHNPQIDG